MWIKKAPQFILILVIITGWIFSGWPQIGNFPPKIQVASADVGHDVTTEFPSALTTGCVTSATCSFTHTPSGTPRGVLIFVYFPLSATNTVTSVTYGGVNVPAVSGGTAADTANEPASVTAYFLGAGVPTGAKTVAVNRPSTTSIYITSTTITSSVPTDLEVYTAGIVLAQENGTIAVSAVDDGSPGTSSMRFGGCYSGATGVTAGTGSTNLQQMTISTTASIATVRETTAGQGSRNVGCSAGNDDRATVYLAVREIPVVATPTYDNDVGTYNNDVTVTISDATSGATIKYCTDTNNTCDPTTGTTGTSASITATATYLRAIATKSGYTNSAIKSALYTLQVANPVFGTNGGSFNNDTTSTQTSATTGAVFCQTVDGTTNPAANTPGTCSTGTTGADATVIATGKTIKVLGTKTNYVNSAVQTSSAFTLTVGAITSSPGAGTYSGTQSVTLNIANTTGATAHYTIDGTAVSCSSASYSSAFNISSTATVKAIACKTNYNSDTAISDLYTITVPAAPTNVAATDGTATDKVTITWTKSTGATNYHVWRDAVDLGAAGDVATFDDTGAAAPTVTAGTASATDGSATNKVTLSISGASANNGTTYTYKVVASNAAGNSVDSVTNTGYRGVGSLTYQWNRSSGNADSGYSTLSSATTAPYDDTGAPAPTITAGAAGASDGTSLYNVGLSISGQSANAGATRYYYATVSATGASSADTTHDFGNIGVGSLTYQWQRSAGDSNASYSDIIGATTASYNDVDAPADGSGRYFKVVENATGASQQISAVDRGYRKIVSISLTTNGSVNFGYVPKNTPKDTTASGVNDVEVVRVDSGPSDLDIESTIFSQGGNTWTLGSGNGDNIVKWEFSKDGTNWSTFLNPAPTSYVFDTNVSESSTRNIYFKITTPTATNSYQQYGTTITIVASAP